MSAAIALGSGSASIAQCQHIELRKSVAEVAWSRMEGEAASNVAKEKVEAQPPGFGTSKLSRHAAAAVKEFRSTVRDLDPEQTLEAASRRPSPVASASSPTATPARCRSSPTKSPRSPPR